MKKIKYFETSKFQRELDRLCRRYRTLPDDLSTAKINAIELLHVHGLDNQSIFPIPGFCSDEIMICKIRKFSCKALKGKGRNSGIRLIYAFFPGSEKVEFVGIYFKGDKENENKDRIRAYLKEKLANTQENNSRLPRGGCGPKGRMALSCCEQILW